MKKMFFIVISLLLCSVFNGIFADEAAPDNSNWGVPPMSQNEQVIDENTTPSENTWNDEHDLKIYNNYGSEKSPAFLNRENINPNESDYGSGSGGVSD